MRNFIFCVFVFALSAVCARAEILLPEIFSDGMVLQQQSNVKIWGWATPGSQVSVSGSWGGSASAVCGADGRWEVFLATPAAVTKAYSLTVTEAGKKSSRKDKSESWADSVTLNDVLIGEVWFCSGQSNMEMPLDGFWDCPIEGSAEEIALAGSWEGIRTVTVPKNGSLVPVDRVGGKWQKCSPENTRWFSATAWHFAKMLHSVLGVPVGVINCSWGGSSVEGWLPEEVVRGYGDRECDFEEPAEGNKGWNWDYSLPYIMYNGMLHPLVGYTVKGFLWYQGESNVGRADTYAGRLADMVSLWRDLWGQGELPFYLVQIAPYAYSPDGEGVAGALLREAQAEAARTIPSSGIVCTNDLVYPYELNQIHPCRKSEVGQRLAYLALNRTYGREGVLYAGPVYREMKVEGSEAHIYFDNDENGFSPCWNELTGFEVAGEDKVFHPAQARIAPGSKYVIVSSPEVPEPVAVRYCFRDFQVGNLRGSRNLPAYPFRTDNW